MKKQVLSKLFVVTILFIFSIVMAQDQQVVEWPLENTNFINNSNTHTILGVPEIAEGLVGNGVLFNGITDGLLIDDNPIANAEAYTVEFYAYPHDTETKAKLLNVWTAEEDSGMFVECWGTTPDQEPLAGYVHFKIHQTNGTYWYGKGFSAALPVDNWYHVAMVITAEEARLYINHELDTTTVYMEDPGYVVGREYCPFSGGFTALGVRGGGNQKDFYTGVLDQVRFTKEELTPDEFMPPPDEVVSYKIWTMESAEFIEGASGDITILGVPEIADGLIGNAVSFNGITDGFLVDENPIAMAEAYTLELYSYPKETETKAKFVNIWTAEEDSGMFVECWGTTPDQEPLAGYVHFKIHQTNGTYWYGKGFSAALPVDHWYHVAMVVDSLDAKLYIDGELDTTVVYLNDPGYVLGREYEPFLNGFTAVGVRGGANQKDFYTGLVDHIKFTKEALTPDEFMPNPDQLTAVRMEDEATGIPETMALLQNYPNPFNPTTTIRYNLSNPSNVTLKIFNIMGKEVRELVAENQQPGTYNVLWDGNDCFGNSVSGGVFFYMIKTNNFTETKKMILLK